MGIFKMDLFDQKLPECIIPGTSSLWRTYLSGERLGIFLQADSHNYFTTSK